MRIGSISLLVAVALAGCGGTSTSAPLSAGDASLLHLDIRLIRTAALANDPTAAHTAVAKLRADVERLLHSGGLSAADARLMLAGAAAADGRISAEVHAPTTVLPTTTPPPDTGAGHGDGHGHDNSHNGDGGGSQGDGGD